MGWIQELDDVMSKNKKVRYSIYLLILLMIISFGGLSFIVIKNAFYGNKVKVGPIELDDTNSNAFSQDTTNTYKRDTTYTTIIPEIRKVQTPKTKFTEPIEDATGDKSSIQQKNEKGDNNNVGRNNSGNVVGNNNKVHKVDGDNNGVNGDVGGDVNFDEKVLLEGDKKYLLGEIQRVENLHNITSKCIIMYFTNNSNGQKYGSQFMGLM